MSRHGVAKNSDKLVFLGNDISQVRHFGVCALISRGSANPAANLTNHYSGEVESEAAYALVQARRPGKTAILGSSMGGTVALIFAAQEPQVAALVTTAAPLHPENFPKQILTPAQIETWREQGFTIYHGQRLNAALLDDLEQLDVVGSARRIVCPVLILHGDADEVVPVAEAYELDDCLTGTKRLEIFKDTDHRLSDPAVMERAIAAALAWLAEHVR